MTKSAMQQNKSAKASSHAFAERLNNTMPSTAVMTATNVAPHFAAERHIVLPNERVAL